MARFERRNWNGSTFVQVGLERYPSDCVVPSDSPGGIHCGVIQRLGFKQIPGLVVVEDTSFVYTPGAHEESDRDDEKARPDVCI